MPFEEVVSAVLQGKYDPVRSLYGGETLMRWFSFNPGQNLIGLHDNKWSILRACVHLISDCKSSCLDARGSGSPRSWTKTLSNCLHACVNCESLPCLLHLTSEVCRRYEALYDVYIYAFDSVVPCLISRQVICTVNDQLRQASRGICSPWYRSSRGKSVHRGLPGPVHFHVIRWVARGFTTTDSPQG